MAFTTQVETGESGNGATQNAISKVRLKMRRSRPKWSRLDFRDQGGDGANFVTEVNTAHFSKIGWKRRDFPYQGADGATFQTETKTARAKKKTNLFYDRGGFGVIFGIRLKTMQLVSPDAVRPTKSGHESETSTRFLLNLKVKYILEKKRLLN